MPGHLSVLSPAQPTQPTQRAQPTQPTPGGDDSGGASGGEGGEAGGARLSSGGAQPGSAAGRRHEGGAERSADPSPQLRRKAWSRSEPHLGDSIPIPSGGGGALGEEVVQTLSFEDCGDGQGPGTAEAAARDAGSSAGDLPGGSTDDDAPEVEVMGTTRGGVRKV